MLTTNNGHSPFQTITSFGQRTINDVYYDQSSLLSSASIWGGNFINSSFEELSDFQNISRCIYEVTEVGSIEQDHFGLDRIVTLSTLRKAWLADGKFKIVLDTVDFGHTIGLVELDSSIEQQKQTTMSTMDERIGRFMERYSWDFCSGKPNGKLTAYFE
ncbi:hypothetical protein B0J11DRAFT_551941 [Dendryphion nanum]|uniref:Uncharacterized protein n=1 Tax=Dendryphion nanum TaxID=256645 RepID=A0A9P9DIL9_9PLEO|nr:hypothetical protein B0J11DRAFT_551941 [Dendryphion nanum]